MTEVVWSQGGHIKRRLLYLLELEEWKNENDNITVRFSNSALYIVAADVQGLYPNIKRTLLMKALEIALQEHTNYGKKVQKVLMWFTDLCLKMSLSNIGTSFTTKKMGSLQEIIIRFHLPTWHCIILCAKSPQK